MPNEYQKDGDLAFVGLNSRDNPSSLPAGIVSQSQNFRMDRGVATVRNGMQRKTVGALVGKTVYGVGTYINSTGQEIIIAVVTDGLYTYNPQTEILSSKVAFPVDTALGPMATELEPLAVAPLPIAIALAAATSGGVEVAIFAKS